MSTINTKPNTDDGWAMWKEFFTTGKVKGLSVEDILLKGREYKSIEDNKNRATVLNNAFEIKFEGLTGIMCFGVKSSNAFKAVYDESKHDMMIAVMVNKDKKYNFSLYGTDDNIDLSTIAKKYKGGGHQHSCGFQANDIDFSGSELKII